MYIAPGRGRQNIGDKIWKTTERPFLLPICCKFQNFIYIFFMFYHMYIALGRGRQSTGDKILMTTERPFLFAHMLQVSKCSLRNLILYTFLMILYMYIAQRQGQKTPETNFWLQQKALITSTICCKFQTNLSWVLILYTFLMFFPHVYSPDAGADNPLWTKSWFQQKSLVTLPICGKFQNNIFLKSDFIHNFSCFYTCIQPRGRGRQLLGVRIFM